MATVYLARDVRHEREVAIKVLHADLGAALGGDRFLAEIMTTELLQHPNILALLDSLTADGLLYYVMPVVTGETLRDRLNRERQLPLADALRIAAEVAGALDYAHRHGVIHRDVKPENILLHDGSAIVADFGIALAVQSASGPRMTQTGLSLGTPHYMAPEQAMGERQIDARADIYALGAVTYEMLTGDPPFTGSSVQAIVAKVMTERPTPPHVLRDTVPPHVEQAVLTALEKLPADRFATAAEFAMALQRPGATAALAIPVTAPIARSPRMRIAAGLAVAAAATAAFLAGRLMQAPAANPRFLQKTFDGAEIVAARFAADGKTVVIGTTSRDIRVIRADYPEAQSLGLGKAQLLAVSSKGELAVLTNPSTIAFTYAVGTLARVPLGGGAPRQLVDNVSSADWSPDGAELAIVRVVGSKERLEYPIGKALYETAGWITDVRMSPDGQRIGFADHPVFGDTRGTIAVVDLQGKKTTITRESSGTYGLAWSPDGKEMYFSARETTHQMVVLATTIDGKIREALNGPGDLIVQDVLKGGDWLVTRNVYTNRVLAREPGDSLPTTVGGWLDYAWAAVLTRDGSELALSDASVEGGPNYSVWLRSTRGGRLAHIGEGWPEGFTSDGKALLAVVPTVPAKLMLYPTGAGTERRIPTPFVTIDQAGWLVTDSSVFVCGHDAAKMSRCLVEDLTGAPARNAAAFSRVESGYVPSTNRNTQIVVAPDGVSIASDDGARCLDQQPPHRRDADVRPRLDRPLYRAVES